MDSREILDMENKLLDPTAEEPISLPLNFLRSITNCFSNEQELGRGGYGVVYKGLLRQGDSFIAVKKFHNSSDVVKGDEQFQKVATSLIKHPNVIQLLGYCAESKGVIKKQENGKRAIVYEQTRILCFEYMCNGGLDKHLSDHPSGLGKRSSKRLSKQAIVDARAMEDEDRLMYIAKNQDKLRTYYLQGIFDAIEKGLDEGNQMQGNPVLLSELRPKGLEYVICVRISRMWEHRGTNEQNIIKHLDLVLVDEKANAIYAEIPPDAIPVCKPHLEKGKIVYVAKITVEKAKPTFKVVDHPYMIRLNKRTIIAVPNDQPDSFPKYTFSLTPFTSLLQYLKNENFLDVIGRIIAVSNAANVYLSSGDLMMRRLIKLQDLSGNTIDLSLVGKRALEFDGETVLKVGQQSHVIAIFVGTLIKVYKGNYHFLSGTSACRWYINLNDIPEIKAFQKSLPLVSEPIQHLYLQSEDDSQRSFEQKTLLQLKDIDPFTEKDKKYECTVTIITITENEPWCYRACTIDNHTIRHQDKNFKCTKEDCTNTQFDWRYKISFFVTDGTYNLEFMIFEKRGAELIGKSAETLRKQYDITQTPPEVILLINHKFTFIVKVLYKSINALEPSFEVVLIKERFGKQPAPPMSQLYKSPAVAPSSTVFAAHEDLPLVLPIGSKNIQGQGETQTMDLDPPSISGKIISGKRDYEESASNNQEIQDDDYPKTKATTKGTSQRLRMGTQEEVLQPDVLREDSLVGLNKIAMKDHAPAWITKDTMKSAVALLQPQCGPVLASVDGSVAALCYQGARNASFWVAHKALASLEDNVLKDWAATINLGPSVEALKRELLSIMAILESTLGKVIQYLALEVILMDLRELVYDAEDVLDEMEYFRNQGDVLDASQNAKGCAHNHDAEYMSDEMGYFRTQDILGLNIQFPWSPLPSVCDEQTKLKLDWENDSERPSVCDEPKKFKFDRENASERMQHTAEQMQLMRQRIYGIISPLGSNWSTIPNTAQSRPITTSQSIEPKLYGRKLMMDIIIHDITKGKYSTEVLTVIPIVKLAQGA
ncbi:unnamed protein product [Miscanthus lutarioriparius]|uniref:Protein kinase domain-containing protein n=1 Tax=Miscanthus lutarioriparius TaxID=422564 RepID=A0A811R9T1_9POAL|nr:unnamed protein product [Miscanthus lutarioriparius]